MLTTLPGTKVMSLSLQFSRLFNLFLYRIFLSLFSFPGFSTFFIQDFSLSSVFKVYLNLFSPGFFFSHQFSWFLETFFSRFSLLSSGGNCDWSGGGEAIIDLGHMG